MNTNSISVQLGTETSLSARMETEASLSAGLDTEVSFSGQLGAGAAVVNDYRIQTEEIEDGHRLTITRGSEVQTFDLKNGAAATDYAPEDKTDSMTQPVGKDADGKLWTAPGGVRFDAAQELTADQQAQARENIGAAVQPEIYEVGIGRQFESFTECLTALKDNDRNKIINVYEGTYDVLEEMGGQAFLDGITSKQMWYDLCPIVPPNTTIVGHGRVEINMELPESNDKLAPLNLMGSAILRNLRISCTNAYTCVRINNRGSKYGNALWIIEDCVLSSPLYLDGDDCGVCVNAVLYDGTILQMKNTQCLPGGGMGGAAITLKTQIAKSRITPQAYIEDCVIKGGVWLRTEAAEDQTEYTVADVWVENSYLSSRVTKGTYEQAYNEWLGRELHFLDSFRVTYINSPHTNATENVINVIPDVSYDILDRQYVLRYTQQTLTTSQKAQARANIAAADAAEVAVLEEAVSRIGTSADRRRFAEKVMLYYGYPNAINNSWDVNNSANIYKDYDVCIFGDGYCLPTHEAHAETVEIFRILKRISPDTRIVGYVPIGVQNVGSDSNLSMDELKRRVDLWKAIGADGIFLDEYGYDYGVTRARQNEIVSYCHDRGMFVFANSWSIEYCFSDEDIVIDWMEDFHPNPNGLRAVLNAQDYYVYEHLFYNSYHDGEGNLHVECAEPYRIDNILQYFHDARIDGKSYREIFGTKVFSLDAIPTGASLREKNEMMSLSIIGAAILNIDAIAFGDDMWSSSGNYHQWDFPQLNLAADGLNSISRSTRTYTDAEGNTAEFTYRWAASINGNQYAIVFDVETPTDVDYVVGKRYAECNGVRVDNAWLTIYDFQEFMDSTAAQVEINTTLVNETVQKVENALPNALQAEEKVNAFMTASDARIEDMESRVNSAISDIEVLTKGFNYLEVEW